MSSNAARLPICEGLATRMLQCQQKYWLSRLQVLLRRGLVLFGIHKLLRIDKLLELFN